MASGHMNRVKRPDTWLHRPMLRNVKKVLANPEPSTHDPGCVKTPTLNLRVEFLSQFRRCGNRLHRRLLL
jgi:hypothetical protein